MSSPDLVAYRITPRVLKRRKCLKCTVWWRQFDPSCGRAIESYAVTGGSRMAAFTITIHSADPGTSSVEHLEENVAAADLKMDEDKMQELARAAQG